MPRVDPEFGHFAQYPGLKPGLSRVPRCGSGISGGEIWAAPLMVMVALRSGIQVGLGHAEGLLDGPQVLVLGDHFGSWHRLDGHVGAIAFEADQRLGPGEAGFIRASGRT